jgi:hypothetical protein
MTKLDKKPIIQFEKDVKAVCKTGKIIRVVDLPAKQGVNIVLDMKVTHTQAEDITRFIKSKYEFEAYFFKKDHAIKVLYKK